MLRVTPGGPVLVHGASPLIVAPPALWVATTGRSGAEGTSSDPFQTLQQAVDAAPSGTTIKMRSGSYTSSHTNITTGGLTIESVDGRGMAKLYPSLTDTETLRITGVASVTLDGLELHGPTAAETLHITRDGANWPESVVVRDCDIYTDAGDGIKVSQGLSITVENCRIEGNANSTAEQGIDFVGVVGGTIANCDVSGFSGSTACVQIKGGSQDVTVRNCYIHDYVYYAIHVGGDTEEAAFVAPYLSDALTNKEEATNCTVQYCKIDSHATTSDSAGTYDVRFIAADGCTVSDTWFVLGSPQNAGRVTALEAAGNHTPGWACGTNALADNSFNRADYYNAGTGAGTMTDTGNTTAGTDPNGGAQVYGLT